MSLENGTYQITSVLTKETIGRDYIEDRSFNPKPIILQKSGLDYPYINWQIERCENDDYYYLKNGGAAVGVVDGSNDSRRIVAILQESFGGRSREWILRPAAGFEEGRTYNIFSSDEGSTNLVWTVEDDNFAPNGGRQIIGLAEFEPSDSKQTFTFIKGND